MELTDFSKETWKKVFHLCFAGLCYLGIFLHRSDLNAQGITLQWAKTMGGAQADFSRGIAVDQNGNVYTAGEFTATADFDPGASVVNLTSNGNADIFISKLDASGNFVWARQMGGPGKDVAYAIAVDAAGNVYTTGTFSGIVDFDPGAGTFNLTSSGGWDIFIHKLDPSGNLIWVKQIGSTGNDGANALVLDASGNVFTTGQFNSTVDFDPGPGTYTLNSGGTDFYISKLDVNGNFVLAKNIAETPSNVDPHSIQVDGAGNIYLSGIFNYTVDFCPGVGVHTLAASGALLDCNIFIAKYDAATNFIYAKSFGGPVYDDCRSMAVDAAGNVYTTGYVDGVVDFDPGPAIYNMSGGTDFFVQKLDPSGNFAWAKRMGYAGTNFANTICLDAAGNIYTSGQFYSTVDFDPGPASYTIAGNPGGVFIHKLDPSGNFVFAEHLASNGNSWGQSMAIDGAGSLYLTGAYSSTIDLDPGPGMQVNNSTGSWDIFVEKFEPCPFVMAGAITGSATVCSGAAVIYSTAPVSGATGYRWAFPFGWTGAGNTNSISVVTTTSGILSVAATNTCGTSASTTLSITVTPSPTLSVNSGTICEGQSFTIVPSGTSSYSFQGGNAIVSPTTNSTFTVIGINASGCASSTAAVSSVTVRPAPVISVSSGSICTGKNFTITASGATSYTFSGGSAIVSPSISASYSVTGTNTAGCVSNSAAISNVTVYITPTITVNSGTLCPGQSFTILPSGALTYTYSGGSSVVSPPASTAYSISGTSTAGCVSQFPAVSSVTLLPGTTITVNSGSICTGSSFTLNPAGAVTYTFSGGSAVVNPLVSSNYFVSGTNAFGCTSLVSAVSTVIVFPRPAITVNSGTICEGQSFVLVPSGAATYTFSGGNSVVNPLVTTSYSVTGKSSAGCVSILPAISTITVNENPDVAASGGNICPGYSFTFTPSGADTYSYSGGSNVVSPAGTTDYSITGRSAEGCTVAIKVTVSVSNTLNVAIAGNNTVCAGSSVEMKASGATAYSWSTGETTPDIFPLITKSTVYSVVGSSETCSTTAQLSIVAFDLPALSLLSSADDLCAGNSVTLNVSGASSYVWNSGSTATSLVLTPSVTGTYSVTGTDLNGCSTMTSITQEVHACDFMLFPNPTYDKITIRGGKIMSDNLIEVYDPLGRIITKLEFNNNADVDLTDKASGVYLIKLIFDEGFVVWRVVKL